MRIAIVPSFIAPVAEGRCFGGAEMAALALTEALAARGEDVSLVGVAGSVARGAAWIEAAPTPAFVPGEEVTEDPAPFEPLLARLRTFDVVHTHLNDPGALHALARWKSGGPRVLATLHLSAVFPATTRAVQRAIDEGAAIQWVAPSAFAAASYERGEAIAVVPNGVEPDQVAWAAEPVDDRLAWAGRKVPEKGLDVALEVARRASRRIEIAGAGALFVGPGVIDHGRVSRREVHAMFARAAAVLVTSTIAEAHPLVAIEALMAGTPVVGFDVGGLSEIVDADTGVLVRPGDVDALVGALEVAARLSRVTCRARAVARFSEARMVELYRAIYRGGVARA